MKNNFQLGLIGLALGLAFTTTGCRLFHKKSGTSTLATVSSSGPVRMLYSGFHDVSKRFTNRTCIVPAVALNTDGTIKTEFLIPGLDTKGEGNTIENTADSVNGAAGKPIVQVSILSSSNQLARIERLTDEKSSNLMRKLGGGLDVNMNFTGGKLSGAAEAALENGSSDRSLTYSYIADLQAASIQVAPPTGTDFWKLTQYGKQIAFKLQSITDPNEQQTFLTSRCGTNYVSQVHYGAKFFANLKITTTLASDKDLLKGKLALSSPFGNSGGTSINLENFKTSGAVTSEVKIFQMGGSTARAATILNEAKDCITISGCIDAFRKIQHYATAIDLAKAHPDLNTSARELIAPGFAGQLNDQTREGYVVTGYETLPYYLEDFELAGMFGPERSAATNNTVASVKENERKTPLNKSDELNLSALESMYESFVSVWTAIRDATKVLRTTSDQISLSEVEVALISNMAQIRKTFEECEKYAEKCADEVATVKVALEREDSVRSLFARVTRLLIDAQRTWTFADYCVHTGRQQLRDPNLGSRWRKSMALLNRKTANSTAIDPLKDVLETESTDNKGSEVELTVNANHKLTNFCAALAEKLATTEDLDFRDSELTELLIEPVGYISSLRDLEFNAINGDRLDSLLNIPHLEALKIHDAVIANPFIFQNIPHLADVTFYDLNVSDSPHVGGSDSLLRSLLLNKGVSHIKFAIEHGPSKRNLWSKPKSLYVNMAYFQQFLSTNKDNGRRMSSLTIDDDQIEQGRIKMYPIRPINTQYLFGYSVNTNPDGKRVCNEVTNDPETLYGWHPVDGSYFNPGLDPHLMNSPCCSKVKSRCESMMSDKWQFNCAAIRCNNTL